MRSSDYTRLKQRENKLWEFGGIAIPGGLSTTRAAVAGGVFALLLGLSALAGQLSGNVWVGVVGVVFGAACAMIAYALAGHHSPDRMTLGQRVTVMLDYAFAQPRRISGFSRDAEPDTIRWRAIIWEPTDDRWLATRAAQLDPLPQEPQ